MKKYDDSMLVEAYKETKRCRLVAERFGCSDETVRRALIKYNVSRTKNKSHPRKETKGKVDLEERIAIVNDYYTTSMTIRNLAQKYHRSPYTISYSIKKYGGGLKECEINKTKITDEQIRQEAKSNSAYDIARKYNISPERLSRRAKKRGINFNWNSGAPHRWKQRAAFYNATEFDETITLKALRARDKDICQICGEPVNDKDIKDGHIRKRYPTLDHIIPLSKGGSHTWDNIQLAHIGCNAGKCDRTGK
jgi:5-methylcytosine-specific restriction endonuclease McrA